MNAFEAGTRKVIPAVLVYVWSGDRVLMIHRNAADASGDYHAGKWNGLGGKLEADESPLEAAHREVREESGLDLGEEAFRSLGTLQFPLFKAHKAEDWLVFVFWAEARELSTSSSMVARCAEGELHWIPVTDLLSLNLWPGDRLFLPHVLKRKPFFGTIWYREQKVVRHWVQELYDLEP